MSRTVRVDDWSNALASLGSVRDKATGMSFSRRRRLERRTLETMYEQNAICARIVDRMPDDAFREGWELANVKFAPGHEDFDLSGIMRRLQTDLCVNEVVKKAAKWSRLYGGALVVMNVIDGQTPEEPLDIQNAARLYKPMVVASDDAPPLEYDSAFGSPTYREILSYQLSGLIATSSPVLKIHHSRTLKLEPIDLPLEARLDAVSANNGWGPSVLDRPFDDLANEGSTRKHAVSMLYIASILYVKLGGLSEALKSANGEEDVRKILASLRENLDVLGLLGLDANDEIGAIQHTVQGIADLIDKMRDALASATDMPREILFNESPAGLNAGQLTGPQQIWYARVSAYQEEELTPVLTRLLKIAFAIWGVPIIDFEIDWLPLWTKSDETAAETAERNMKTDLGYMSVGVVTRDEVRRARFLEGRQGAMEVSPDTPTPAGGDIAVALEIAKAVTAGEIPRSAGAQMMIASGNSPMLLGDAGENMPALAAAPEPLDVPEPEDAVDIRDAAKRVGVPTATLTAAIRRGDLRYWGYGARRTISMRDLAHLGRAHEAPVEPAPE